MAATALLVTSLVATGFSFIQNRNAAKAARNQAKADARAEEIRFRGELIDRKRKFIAQQKSNIAASAASGIDPFSGSAATITEEGFRQFNLEQTTARASSDSTIDSIKRGGKQRERSFNTAAAGSLINFASQQATRGSVPSSTSGGQKIN